MHVILVHFEIKPPRANDFRECIIRNARASLDSEPGCLRFDVCFDPNDSASVLLYEVYHDEAAFQAHLASNHFKAFDQETSDWVQGKTISVWQREFPSH